MTNEAAVANMMKRIQEGHEIMTKEQYETRLDVLYAHGKEDTATHLYDIYHGAYGRMSLQDVDRIIQQRTLIRIADHVAA